jgi:uncharacterized membrane protein YqjE
VESNSQRKHELRIPPPPGEPKRPVPPLAPTPTTEVAAAPAGAVQNLSTVELVKEITAEVTRLASKQIELAKTELKEDIKTEAIAIGGLSIAALAGICTINLLLVTAVFALATTMPGWAAGLVVSGITLAATASIAWLAWSKRVRKPMARTQRTLKDDVQWTKERLA